MPAGRAARGRGGPAAPHVARRRARAHDLGALVPREPAPSRSADRGRRGRGLPRHGAARGRDRRRHRDHLLRLPGRVGALAASELGHVLVAGRLPGDARVAVGRARASLLGRRRRVRGAARGSRRDRAAPGLRRLQHRLDAAAPRERGRRASASTSIPRTCSGRAWIRSPASTRSRTRSSTCMRRTPASRRTSWRSTACSSRSRATAQPSGAGSSARSARGIPSSSGATSSPLSSEPATTARSRSSTRIRSSRTPTGSSSP